MLWKHTRGLYRLRTRLILVIMEYIICLKEEHMYNVNNDYEKLAYNSLICKFRRKSLNGRAICNRTNKWKNKKNVGMIITSNIVGFLFFGECKPLPAWSKDSYPYKCALCMQYGIQFRWGTHRYSFSLFIATIHTLRIKFK